MLFVVGCGGEESSSDSSKGANAPAASEEAPAAAGLSAPFAEGPLMLTSAGQSADVKMIESLIQKGGMEYAIDVVLQPAGMGEAKTLVIAIGGSSKGLGAAGIDTEEEIERVAAVIEDARAQELKIIGMHVGGVGRRGELSDKFINASAHLVDYLVVVKGGDNDGLLTQIAITNGIPMETVDSIVGSYAALKKAFP